jgi:hypothetical protein
VPNGSSNSSSDSAGDYVVDPFLSIERHSTSLFGYGYDLRPSGGIGRPLKPLGWPPN